MSGTSDNKVAEIENPAVMARAGAECASLFEEDYNGYAEE